MVLVSASIARAQSVAPPLPTTGLDELVLNPGPGPIVGTEGRTAGKHNLRIGLALHYEKSPLRLMQNGAALGDVIGNRVSAHLFGVFGIFDWLDVQLQLPIVFFQNGDNLSAYSVSAVSTAGVGSPVLGARAQLLAVRRDQPLDLALQLSVAIPLGSAGAITGGRLAFLPALHAGRSFGMLHLGGLVQFAVQKSTSFGKQSVGNSVELDATIGVGNSIRGEITGRGLFSLTGAKSTGELLLGVRALNLSPVDLFLMGGPALGTTPGTPNFRILGGIGLGSVYASPAVADPCAGPDHTPAQCPELDDDNDGVLNKNDTCATLAEDKDGFEDADGCPETDNDRDGIDDGADKCPQLRGVAEYAGCPVPDQDKDGVMDADDACPTEAGPASRKGCPFRDNDQDGIEDAVDQCPSETGLLELKGCPARDRDGDSVADHLDNCPDEKGTTANQGCPEKKKQWVVITKEKLIIKDKIYFATGKAQILPKSFPLLDQIAEVIKGHSEIARLVVEGHTDNTGSAELNRKLSQDRAEAVVTYLIGKAVGPGRLTAKGFGPDRPAADNQTASGREQNRRVEFTIPAEAKESP